MEKILLNFKKAVMKRQISAAAEFWRFITAFLKILKKRKRQISAPASRV